MLKSLAAPSVGGRPELYQKEPEGKFIQSALVGSQHKAALHISFWAWCVEDALEKEKGRRCTHIPASSNPRLLCFLELEAVFPGVKKYIPSLNSPPQCRKCRAQLLEHCILALGSIEILQTTLKGFSVPPSARSHVARLKTDVGRVEDRRESRSQMQRSLSSFRGGRKAACFNNTSKRLTLGWVKA